MPPSLPQTKRGTLDVAHCHLVEKKVHRPDRLLLPFPRAMLRVEIFAMTDDNQRGRALLAPLAPSEARLLRLPAASRERQSLPVEGGSLVTSYWLRDRLSKPSANGLNPFKINRVQFWNRPSYRHPRTTREASRGTSELAGLQAVPTKKRGRRTRAATEAMERCSKRQPDRHKKRGRVLDPPLRGQPSRRTNHQSPITNHDSRLTNYESEPLAESLSQILDEILGVLEADR